MTVKLAVFGGWFDGRIGADIHAQLAEFNPVKISSPWKHGGWHADSGYGASRSMTSVVYDLEYGETARNVCDIRLAESMGG